MYFTADDPEPNSLVRYEVRIPLKNWLIAGGVFLGSVVNYIYAAAQLARVRKTMPPHPGEKEKVLRYDHPVS